MLAKKAILLFLTFCLLLAGCSDSQADSNENSAPTDNMSTVAVEDVVDTEQLDAARTVTPLPDTTMENLTDAILPVSLGKGNTYVDEDGHTQMELKIYTYDQYDMVDIATLKVGDTIIRHSGAVEVLSLERSESGRIRINGGLENNGFDLTTDDSGMFYEIGFNDIKNWYEVGAAIIRVSADFKGIDYTDLDLGEVTIHPEDFLNGAVTNYDFTPYNTTVRVENGQIVEMNRRYTP